MTLEQAKAKVEEAVFNSLTGDLMMIPELEHAEDVACTTILNLVDHDTAPNELFDWDPGLEIDPEDPTRVKFTWSRV